MMHELTIINELVETVTRYRREHDNRAISGLTLEVGSLTCVDPDRLMFCFDMVKQQAGLAQAQLLINREPARASCHNCGRHFRLEQLGQACACGSYRYTVDNGQALNLTEIEFI